MASIGEFEIVAGINGKVFVSSKLVKVQVLLAKLIQECHCRDVSSMKNIVAKEMAAFDRK